MDSLKYKVFFRSFRVEKPKSVETAKARSV